MFPLKERKKVCNQIFSKTISSEAFLLERKTQFWKHCVNDFVRWAKIFSSYTPEKVWSPSFPHFSALILFFVIPTMTFIQSMLKNIQLKIRQIASQSLRKSRKRNFPTRNFLPNYCAGHLQCTLEKTAVTFSPICERLLTKVHKKFLFFQQTFLQQIFGLVEKNFCWSYHNHIAQSLISPWSTGKTKKILFVFYKPRMQFWEDC